MMTSRGSMTLPRDLLIFLPWASLTTACRYTCNRKETGAASSSGAAAALGGSDESHLFEGQLSSQFEAHHHHTSHPEEEDVVARFQQGARVENLQVLRLQRKQKMKLLLRRKRQSEVLCLNLLPHWAIQRWRKGRCRRRTMCPGRRHL